MANDSVGGPGGGRSQDLPTEEWTLAPQLSFTAQDNPSLTNGTRGLRETEGLAFDHTASEHQSQD